MREVKTKKSPQVGRASRCWSCSWTLALQRFHHSNLTTHYATLMSLLHTLNSGWGASTTCLHGVCSAPIVAPNTVYCDFLFSYQRPPRIWDSWGQKLYFLLYPPCLTHSKCSINSFSNKSSFSQDWEMGDSFSSVGEM